MTNMRKLLSILMILCVCLDWGCTEGSEQRESYFDTIQVSSLFPSSSSSCVLPSKASKTKSSLHVVHRQGPCSRLSSGKTASIVVRSSDSTRSA
ncbi:unnamed protein product [Thlaspi arvense]|uniref:Secreted protein n=1 Tax=Thlaspi arvense TaxID=13288 RepID=A0AAU9T563_THLAR|nr:unnamed protein product [Thlaspi arvense]